MLRMRVRGQLVGTLLHAQGIRVETQGNGAHAGDELDLLQVELGWWGDVLVGVLGEVRVLALLCGILLLLSALSLGHLLGGLALMKGRGSHWVRRLDHAMISSHVGDHLRLLGLVRW